MHSLSLAHPLFLFVYLSHKNINTHNNHTHTLTRTRTNTLTFNLHSFQRYFHTRHTTPTLTLIHTIMHTSDSNTVLPYFVFCLLQMCVCHFSTVNLCAVYTVHGVICARHTPSMLHIETFLRPSAPLPRWSMPFHLPGKKVVLQPPFAQTAAKAPACKNMHSTYASYRDARRRRSRPSPSTSFICFHVFLPFVFQLQSVICKAYRTADRKVSVSLKVVRQESGPSLALLDRSLSDVYIYKKFRR